MVRASQFTSYCNLREVRTTVTLIWISVTKRTHSRRVLERPYGRVSTFGLLTPARISLVFLTHTVRKSD